jgi:hypothetical protein
LIVQIIKESKTWLLYITTILKFFEKEPSILLKLLGLSRFFHETWQFFEVFEIPETGRRLEKSNAHLTLVRAWFFTFINFLF